MKRFKQSNSIRELTLTEVQSVSGGSGLLGSIFENLFGSHSSIVNSSNANRNSISNSNAGLPGALGDTNTQWLPWFNTIIHSTWAKPIINSPWMQTPGMQNIIKSPWFHSIAAKH